MQLNINNPSFCQANLDNISRSLDCIKKEYLKIKDSDDSSKVEMIVNFARSNLYSLKYDCRSMLNIKGIRVIEWNKCFKLKEICEQLLESVEQDFPPSPFKLQVDVRDERYRSIGLEEVLTIFPSYDPTNKTIDIAGVKHSLITADRSNFYNSEMPLVYCGGFSQEIISFDPKNSNALENCYQKFIDMIKDFRNGPETLSPEVIANVLKMFMNYQVFLSDSQGKAVDLFIEQCRADKKTTTLKSYKGYTLPCISIDAFLNEGLGLCRHHALVGAYLMDRLMAEHKDLIHFNAKIQVMRDFVEGGGAHAWLTLVCEDGQILCIDTLNNYIGDLYDLSFRSYFAKMVGVEAIMHQIKKAHALQLKVLLEKKSTNQPKLFKTSKQPEMPIIKAQPETSAVRKIKEIPMLNAKSSSWTEKKESKDEIHLKNSVNNNHFPTKEEVDLILSEYSPSLNNNLFTKGKFVSVLEQS